MPYYKGVHFDEAYRTEGDLLPHNSATPAGDVVAAPAPEPEPSASDLAVLVDDRTTPIVEVSPEVESDPFPSFTPEKEPETQPEEPSADDIEASIVKTPAESPDAKKKKKPGRA